MKRSSKRLLSSVFLVLTVFLFNLFVYDHDTYSPNHPVCPQDITHIEFVVQLENPQIYDDSTSNSPGEKSPSFKTKHSFKYKISPLCFKDCTETNLIFTRHQDFPADPILSTLQKKNHWHQSSDDEPFPHI